MTTLEQLQVEYFQDFDRYTMYSPVTNRYATVSETGLYEDVGKGFKDFGMPVEKVECPEILFNLDYTLEEDYSY